MSIHRPEIAPLAASLPTPQPKARQVPKKVRQAIMMMVQGNCRTWAAAAKRVGCAPETMSRYFKRPECRQALRDSVERSVLMAGGRASARLTQLLDSSSQRTSLDATRLALQALGVVGNGQHNVSVNVGVELKAGYVIDLSEPNLPHKIITGEVVEAKPVEQVAGIGPGAKSAE